MASPGLLGLPRTSPGRQQASLSWLWENDAFSDMRLQLSAVKATPPCSQGTRADDGAVAGELPQPGSSGRSRDRHSISCMRGSSEVWHARVAKVPRRSEGEASAPQAATALETAAAETACPPLTPTAAPATDLPGLRTLRLHAIVMASSSAYFSKRVSPREGGDGGSGVGGLRYADRGGGAAGGKAHGDRPYAGGLLLVEHLEEGEVDAMEAVLRHCYTYQLCEGGLDPAHVPVDKLLQMLALSDRFDVPLCAAHCCEELAGRPCAEYTIDAINTVLGSLPPGVRSCPAFQAVTEAASARLLQLLGDAEVVGDDWYREGSDGVLTAQLHRLSLPSLLVLLASSDLRARSENSVLVMANDWVDHSGGPACSRDELRQVAAALRLCGLTPAYLFDVLPRLTWLQMTAEERESLLMFVAAPGAVGAAGRGAAAAGAPSPRQAVLRKGNGLLVGPPAWYDMVPRKGYCAGGDMLVVRWERTSEQLEHLLRAAATHGDRYSESSDYRFLNGFVVSLSLHLSKHSQGWRAWVAHSVGVDISVRQGVAGDLSEEEEGGSGTRLSPDDGVSAARVERAAAHPGVAAALEAACAEGGQEEAAGGKGEESAGSGEDLQVAQLTPVVCRSVHTVARCGVLLRDDRGYAAKGHESAEGCGVKRLCTPLHQPRGRVPGAQLLDIASWAPYLGGGKLCMECSLTACE